MPLPSRAAFDQLSLPEQIGIVFGQGTFLLRCPHQRSIINLYYLGSFFAEVYYDPVANYLHHCRTFVRKEELENYIVYIDLPEL